MNKRRVIVTIELLTDEKLGHLSSSNRWQMLIDHAWASRDELSIHVAQVQANVVRETKAKKARRRD